MRYVEALPGDLDIALAGLADQAARLAAIELGLPVPAVRWFRSARPGESVAARFEDDAMSGCVTSPNGPIWVSAEQAGRGVALTVSHEVRHLDQWKSLRSSPQRSLRRKELEAEAEAYANAFIDRHTVALGLAQEAAIAHGSRWTPSLPRRMGAPRTAGR